MAYGWQPQFLSFMCAFALGAAQFPETPDACPGSGKTAKTLADLSSLINGQMAKNHASRATYAVTVNGRLVLTGQIPEEARHSTKVALSSSTLFRIANVSKPLTAAAIYSIAGPDRQSLNDKPFSPRDGCANKKEGNGFCGLLSGLVPGDLSTKDRQKIEKITIQQLIDHTAGWNRDACIDVNKTGINWAHDPVFDCFARDPGITRERVITEVLSSPLLAEPGDLYQYCNFGYLVLGEVIRAHRSCNSNYEQCVKDHVLTPAGIDHMRLGSNTPSPTDEVDEYVTGSSRKFSMSLMEADGGWLASPKDLVRWLGYIDGQRSIQKGSSLRASPVPPNGFKQTWTYYGSLPGTTAILHLEPIAVGGKRISWAVLFNGRNEANGHGEQDAQQEDAEIAKLLSNISPSDWPSCDLFTEDPRTSEQLNGRRFDNKPLDANLFLHDLWAASVAPGNTISTEFSNLRSSSVERRETLCRTQKVISTNIR